MRKHLLNILFVCLFVNETFSQCATLQGDIKDDVLDNLTNLNIDVKINGKRKKIGKSDSQGTFQVKIPCEASELIIEGQGYRSISIPIQNNKYNQVFYISLNILPIDKQAVDKPYFQKDQKNDVLKNTVTTSEKSTIRYFKIIDTKTKQQIKANVCLFYTKSEIEKCFDITEQTQEKIIFNDEDIIELKVKAEGYQDYVGNLYINKLDNKSSFYEISLSKSLDILAFIKPNMPNNIDFFDKNSKKIEIYKKENYLYAFIDPQENYLVKTTILEEDFKKNISLKEGLNFLVLDNFEKVPKDEVIRNNPIIASNKKNFTIYFDQSDYILKKEAKKNLDTISAILQNNKFFVATITGYTDNIGDPERNITLSEYRAKATFSYLFNHNISEKRLKWSGLGGKNPIYNNETEENKSKNRRVEIRIIDESIVPSPK